MKARFFALLIATIMLWMVLDAPYIVGQNPTNQNYHFLVLGVTKDTPIRTPLYVLTWDREQVILDRLSNPFLDSLIIPLAEASLDGNILLLIRLSSEYNFDLALFNQSGEFIRYLTQLEIPLSVWESLDISSDNRYVVSYTEKVNAIVLIELNPSQPATQFIELVRAGVLPTISYDGRFIAYDEGFGIGNYSIKLIDLGENIYYQPDSEIKITSELQERCSNPDFHPSAYKIVYSCLGNSQIIKPSIFITDITTGETMAVLSGDNMVAIDCLRWSPVGEKLMWVDSGTIYIYHLETKQQEEISMPIDQLQDIEYLNCPVWLNW